jgi:citrate lyase subunit beta / citryl-CoA lyase
MSGVLIRPRRSCLYIPGGNTRAVEKARDLNADTVIFDLEDAVLPEFKEAARDAVVAELQTRMHGTRETIVRINALDTPWAARDIAAIAAASPDGILIPKIQSGTDILHIDAALDAAGADKTMGVWAMIEMPRAIMNITEIARMSEQSRLCGFVAGVNDLAKEMRVTPAPGRAAFQTALSLTLMAARCHGLCVIDGVYNEYLDMEGLQAECDQGRMLGFDGKTLIHPSQLETANRVFAPSPDDVATAKAIVAAFAAPENAGKGVLSVNGKMTELLHLKISEHVLAMHDTICEMAG